MSTRRRRGNLVFRLQKGRARTENSAQGEESQGAKESVTSAQASTASHKATWMRRDLQILLGQYLVNSLSELLWPRDRAFRRRRDQRAILAEHSGCVTWFWWLPLGHSSMYLSIANFDFEYALVHVNANHVSFVNCCNRAAQRCFWRDVSHHQAVSRSAETAVSQ